MKKPRHQIKCIICGKPLGKHAPYFDGKNHMHTNCYFFIQKAKELGWTKKI